MTVSTPPQVVCDHCGKTDYMLSVGVGASYGQAWQLPMGWLRIEQNLGFSGAGTFQPPPEVDALADGRTYCSVDHGSKGLDELHPAGPYHPR